MTIMATYTVRGDTEDLLARYDRALPRIIETAAAKPLSHVCLPASSGIRILDVWESETQLQDFASNPQFGMALREHVLPEPEVEVSAVHRFAW